MTLYFEDVEDAVNERRERKKRREHKKWAQSLYGTSVKQADDFDEAFRMRQITSRREKRKIRQLQRMDWIDHQELE